MPAVNFTDNSDEVMDELALNDPPKMVHRSTNSDCILSHNGGEPLMIRKKGEYYIEQDERFEEALGYNVK